jgi:acyl dehydratase
LSALVSRRVALAAERRDAQNCCRRALRAYQVGQVQQEGTGQVAGLYFEEFSVGQRFDHRLRRTVTEADNVFFSALTHNPAALHLDEEYCREHSEYGQRIVNSCFTLGLMVGISVGDTTLGTTVANLGWDQVKFPKPLFHGDTVRIESEVRELRDSRSRPDNGIVVFEHRAYNQHGDLVASCLRSALMLRLPAAEGATR